MFREEKMCVFTTAFTSGEGSYGKGKKAGEHRVSQFLIERVRQAVCCFLGDNLGLAVLRRGNKSGLS